MAVEVGNSCFDYWVDIAMSVLLLKYWKPLAGLALAVVVALFVNNYLNERDAKNQNIGFDDAVTKTNDAADKLKGEVKSDVEKNNESVDKLDSDAVNDELDGLFKQEGYEPENGASTGGDLSEGYGMGEVASVAAGSAVDKTDESGTQESVVEESEELEEFDGQMQTANGDQEDVGLIYSGKEVKCKDAEMVILALSVPGVTSGNCIYNNAGEAVMMQPIFE